MSSETEFRTKLAAIARRLRLLTIEARVSWCLLAGLGLALGLLAAHKLDRLEEPWGFMLAAVALSVGVGALWGLLRPISLFSAAALADENLGLKERLSNAVVFAASPDASPLVPALLRDADEFAARVSPAEVLPHRLQRSTLLCAVVAAAMGAAWFAPIYPVGRSAGELAVRKQMREQGKELRAAAKRAEEEAKKKDLRTPAELAKKLEQLAKELEQAKLSKKQALLKTGKLAAELREAQKRAALAASAGKVAKAAEALKSVPFATSEGQDLAKAVHERKLGDLSARLEKLAKQLKEGEFASAAEREKLAGDLGQMSEAFEEAGLGGMAAALKQAASDVKDGKASPAAEALEQAAAEAAQAGQQAAESASIEQMARQLEESQQQVAQADQGQGSTCPSCGQSNCPGAKPGGG